MNWPDPITAVLSLVALGTGVLAGWLHFVTLSHLSKMLVDGKIAAVGLQVARFVVLAGLFYVWARTGALPLLACAAGVLAGRKIILKRFKVP
ncbi:N-ATPase, AtpR subunit [Ensifer adhaerens]|nr:N-ATPase, AtpR subunit [Ensifer adhaerens]